MSFEVNFNASAACSLCAQLLHKIEEQFSGEITEYHEFFGEIYEDVDGTIDTFAEWLRKFDVQSPYTLQQFMDAQSFGEVLTNSNSPIVMSRMLYVMNERMINDSKEMFDVATLLKEQGLANFLADRLAAHEKWGWFLRSVIKQTIN